MRTSCTVCLELFVAFLTTVHLAFFCDSCQQICHWFMLSVVHFQPIWLYLYLNVNFLLGTDRDTPLFDMDTYEIRCCCMPHKRYTKFWKTLPDKFAPWGVHIN